MLKLGRHCLLALSVEGRIEAERLRVLAFDRDAALWELFPALPPIDTGRRTEEGLLQIGFSYPVREGERRIRIASKVKREHVLSSLTPWEIAARAAERESAIGARMREIHSLAEPYALRLGLFGSAALESETGFPYLHRNSDLDLLVDRAPYAALKSFDEALKDWAYRNGRRIDVELQLRENCCCKLAELLREQSTVLCRGGAEPVLLSRRVILQMLRAADDKV